MSRLVCLGLSLLALLTRLDAQTLTFHADVNTTRSPISGAPYSGGYRNEPMIKFGSHWYFAANTHAAGYELWKTDGTKAGTVMVKDIRPGWQSSGPGRFCVCRNKLFFTADDGVHGIELWVSDGTAAGTVLVRDIRAGRYSSNASELVCLNNNVIFRADDGVKGAEIWTSNGTKFGTVIVKDIRPGAASSYPQNLTVSHNNLVYFRADDGIAGSELWATSGGSTARILDIWPGASSSSPSGFTVLGGRTLFLARRADGTHLYSTNGVPSGLVEIRKKVTGLSKHAILGGKAYFIDNQRGKELWRTNGTSREFIRSLTTATTGFYVQNLYAHNGAVYFGVSRGSSRSWYSDLYKSDGTSAGTVRLRYLGHGSSFSYPENFFAIGTKLIFGARTSTGYGLWQCDGTTAGTTVMTPNMSAYYPTPVSATKVLFRGYDQTAGAEMFETDGTTAGTRLFKDIEPLFNTADARIQYMTCANAKTMYFSAIGEGTGEELWKTEGGTTQIVKDLYPGTGSSSPTQITSCFIGGKSLTFFRARTSTTGEEPCVTDGTSAGTKLLKDIAAGTRSSYPSGFTKFRDKVFFTAEMPNEGSELFCTDGTAAGTVMLKSHPTYRAIRPYYFTVCGDALYFSGYDLTGGSELWKSDGTAAGTKMLKDLVPGLSGSSPRYLTCFRNRLLFSARTAATGYELFISDGTAVGTKLLKDIAPGTSSSSPSGFVACGDVVYFEATHPSYGRELWQTDLTAAGTKLVANIGPGTAHASIYQKICCGEKLFFGANGAKGRELYIVSKFGLLLVDLYPGSSGTRQYDSSPYGFTCGGGGVFFRASLPGEGAVLVRSDGTVAGTKLYARMPGVRPGTLMHRSSTCGGVVYFQGDHARFGEELYRVGGLPGTAERLGSPCGKAGGTLHSSDPILGGVANITSWSAPGSPGLLILGVPHGPIPLPGVVKPHCPVFLDPGLIVNMFAIPAGKFTLPAAIPNQPVYLGQQVMLQTVYGASPADASNGLLLTVGPK